MKPFVLDFNQNLRFNESGYWITHFYPSRSYWAKYVGNDTFHTILSHEINDPDLIPAVFFSVKIMSSVSKSSNEGEYYLLYYKSNLYIYDLIMRAACVINDKRSLKKVINYVSSGKISFFDGGNLEFVIDKFMVDGSKYFD